jgi:hypothetical protein
MNTKNSETSRDETNEAVVGQSGSSLAPIKSSEVDQTLKATGPRTPAGKTKSSRNATKHGIFSSVTLLKGESRQEYSALREGLQDALLPQGQLEELLVEKLASISWRQRRLLTAEGAEIQRGTDFLEWDQCRKEEEEAQDVPDSSPSEILEKIDGLICKRDNTYVLSRCIELLLELRQDIERDGINRERDEAILDEIYGDKKRLDETLRESYSMWVEKAEVSEEEQQREVSATAEQCKEHILSEIRKEISRLKAFQKERTAVESKRTELEILRRVVPDSPHLDRLMRYEASLERSFDRTLGQLERIQRIRRGQPVAPRIDVNVSQ